MSLFDKRLVIIGGKGGVGRTTVAASFAVAAARRGKRVLVAQTKAKERLSHLFGIPSVGPELVRVRERLSAVNMSPLVALREYGTMVLRSEFIAKQVLENKVSRAFLHAVPGIDEYSMLGKVWYHTTEEEGGRPKWDLCILDGPATGHLLTMLQTPLAILDAVPEGPLTRPAAATMELLRDPARSSLVIVTLAEDMPANEAVELAARNGERVKMPLGPLVVNQLYPPRFGTGPSAQALHALPEDVGDAALQPQLTAARTAQRRRALNDRYLAQLGSALPGPQIQLPYLFREDFGPEAIEELSQRIEGQILGSGQRLKFQIDDRFDATLGEFERLLDDPSLYGRLAAAMPGLQSIELLGRVEDARCIRRRLRFTPNTDGKIPAFGRSVIKPAMLCWIEESSYDKTRHRFDYRILPQLPESWRDRFSSHGTYLLWESAGKVARRIEGEVVVRVPLFGRTVEKLLIREVSENFRAETVAMSAMLVTARRV